MKLQIAKIITVMTVAGMSWSSLAAVSVNNADSAGDNAQVRARPAPPPFAKLDIDGNGEVTLDEFRQLSIPHGDHQTGFTYIDSNGDGLVSEHEWLDHKPPGMPPRGEARPR